MQYYVKSSRRTEENADAIFPARAENREGNTKKNNLFHNRECYSCNE